jgi:hypothetical protein
MGHLSRIKANENIFNFFENLKKKNYLIWERIF